MTMMVAARLHAAGQQLRLESVPRPSPGPDDIVVAVKACNVVPNLKNVLSADWPTMYPQLPLPSLPAIFGLDAAGIVVEVGREVLSLTEGDRVYVNPARGCGSCRACRGGEQVNCDSMIYQGYFGRGPLADSLFRRYPYGGLAEFTLAPASAAVRISDRVRFDGAARFGYLGTAFSALRKARVRAGSSVLINGIGGTLGLGAALLALGMGATRILGTGRTQTLLDRVKSFAPDRIAVMSVSAGASIRDWALSQTDGEGVDAVIDALPPRAPTASVAAALDALRMGGTGVDIGGTFGDLSFPSYWIKNRNATILGSRWRGMAEFAEMAEMARAGTLDLSLFDHKKFALRDVNVAVDEAGNMAGGFSNIVVNP